MNEKLFYFNCDAGAQSNYSSKLNKAFTQNLGYPTRLTTKTSKGGT